MLFNAITLQYFTMPANGFRLALAAAAIIGIVVIYGAQYLRFFKNSPSRKFALKLGVVSLLALLICLYFIIQRTWFPAFLAGGSSLALGFYMWEQIKNPEHDEE